MENKDMNRYEEVEKKTNPFVKILKMFGTYLRNLGYDFISSFKYNNMKLAAIFVAIPGILFGFFLKWHYNVVIELSFTYEYIDYETFEKVTANYSGMPFDISGIAVFTIMLFSILNLFSALSMSGKKNLGSVVVAAIFGAVVIIMSAVYLYSIFYYISIESGKESSTFTFNTNYVMACISTIGSIVFTVAGLILGFIKYDRTYEKVDR